MSGENISEVFWVLGEWRLTEIFNFANNILNVNEEHNQSN